MLDARSALATAKPYHGSALTISEAPDFTLLQIAGTEKDVKKALHKVPAKIGMAQVTDGHTIMRVSPAQYWLLNGAAPVADGLFLTPLSSSRVRIVLEGEPARAVLAKCMAIDFHDSAFKPGQFVMSGIHHTPVLVHCAGNQRFEVYVLRTFALSAWEFLTDAAMEFASA